jgi:hypothetical protein
MIRYFSSTAICMTLLTVAMSIQSANSAVDRDQSVMTTKNKTLTPPNHPLKSTLVDRGTQGSPQLRGDFENIGNPIA